MNNVGNFFVKIGQGIKKAFFGIIDWVKNTAWVQPLLIVGVIFGVILGLKPAINFVGGLFNPEKTFEFYRNNAVNDMTDLFETKIKGNDGSIKTIVIFYSDSDSSSQTIESSLRTYAATNPSVNWYCVDVLDNDKDEDTHKENQKAINEAFQNTFLDSYAEAYDEMPVDMKNSSYNELTISNDDTTNVKIPTPLFARYDGETLVGVRIGISSSKALEDIELFVEGTRDEWELGKLEK